MKSTTYERSYLGSIVIIKRIVFNQTQNSINQVDHAWRTGRPCVIIYIDDEYDYFLPLSSTMAEKEYYENIKDDYFELSEEKLLYLEGKPKTKTITINLKNYFRKKISGYLEIGKLTEESYNELIRKISAYYNKRSLEDLAKIAVKR